MSAYPIREIKGGITAIEGIQAGGIASGIKKNNRLDLALIVSSTPCTAAAIFTKNRCAAASILFNKLQLRTKKGQAILANSGNANAATGTHGMADTKRLAHLTAESLKIPIQMVYVASTGVIGMPLPMAKIEKAIPRLVASLSHSPEGSRAAADAIRTTDTLIKEIAVVGSIGSTQIRMGGISKGAGMIHPNMATMLAFLATDAAIEPTLLQKGLKRVSDRTFHCITVDGETSTNDMVILLATGRRGTPIRQEGVAYRQFVTLLEYVCRKLAQQIVKDGEGATKQIEIRCRGAKSDRAARQIAFSVARSNLVKTAFFGEDANWGRIIAAIGNAGVPIHFNKLDIAFGQNTILQGGIYQGKSAEASATAFLKNKEVTLTIDLHDGPHSATVWTSDLSEEYVRINAAYRS